MSKHMLRVLRTRISRAITNISKKTNLLELKNRVQSPTETTEQTNQHKQNKRGRIKN